MTEFISGAVVFAFGVLLGAAVSVPRKEKEAQK